MNFFRETISFEDAIKDWIEVMGLSGQAFAKLCQEVAKKLVEQKEISEQQAAAIGMSQASISRKLNGSGLHTRIEVSIWLLALETYQDSDKFKRYKEQRQRKNKPLPPSFKKSDMVYLYHLAGYSTPDDMQQAQTSAEVRAIEMRRQFRNPRQQ